MKTRASLPLLALCSALLAPGAAASQSPPRVRGVPAPEPSESSNEAIASVFRQHAGALRQCYERALRESPALSARSETLRATILPSGRVGSVVVRLQPRSPALERCIGDALRRMVFAPHEGGPIEVSFPMNTDAVN